MTAEDEPWNKAQRLAVAGSVAPALRSASAKTAFRRVALVGKDGGVVGYTTLAAVQEALLLERQIEFEVVEGQRPEQIVCTRCGRIHRLKSHGHVPKLCSRCHVRSCVDCNKALSRTAALKRKNPRCVECAGKARQKPMPRCTDCGVEISRNAKQHRCKPCSFAARQKALPTCARCGKKLSPSARIQPIRHCKPCSYKAPSDKQKAAIAKALKARWGKAVTT